MDNKRPDFPKLLKAAKDARDLAQRLFSNETTGQCHSLSYEVNCLSRETARLKGYPSLPDNSTLRSYSYFDPHKLCSSCLAYWYVEMAAQELARMVTLERHIAAEEGRELPADPA
jgi:hypothetical protein